MLSLHVGKVWANSNRCGAIHDCICWHWCCGHPKQARRQARLSVNETDWRRGPATCCFTNWASRGNLERLWRYNENSNAPWFYQRTQPTVYQFGPLFCLLVISFPPLLIFVFIHSLMLLWNSFLTLTG